MNDKFAQTLTLLYGAQAPQQTERYLQLAERLRGLGVRTVGFASASGRTELGGNHTDHNHGRVLAAAIDLDAVAAVAPRDDGRIALHSQGFAGVFTVDMHVGLEPIAAEHGTTTALLRGVAAALHQRGLQIGGFDAWVDSEVPTGAGLSSSAAFEVLIGSIFNGLYNRGSIAPQVLAIAGQEAENRHFGKPCGLMDQMASALGGVVTIDFADPAAPRSSQVPLQLQGLGFRLAVVDTGGSHADLTGDYAAIPSEMRAVASVLEREVLRGVTMAELLENTPRLRVALGDRALLRAMHFVGEDARVVQQRHALQRHDFATFLALVRASGASSQRWLQNVVPAAATRDQGMALALAITEDLLQGQGACRVHGGGFAGAIQVWLPVGLEAAYQARMEPVFGANCVRWLAVRPVGAAWLPVEDGHSSAARASIGGLAHP